MTLSLPQSLNIWVKFYTWFIYISLQHSVLIFQGFLGILYKYYDIQKILESNTSIIKFWFVNILGKIEFNDIIILSQKCFKMLKIWNWTFLQIFFLIDF